MKLTDSFLSLVKGGIVGISSLIPSLSSGSVMKSLNVYENFIEAISNILKPNNKKLYLIAIPLLIGILGGLLGGYNVIDYFYKKFPNQTLFLFIGLIFGGIKISYKQVDNKINIKKILICIIVTCLLITIYFLLTKYISFTLPNNYLFKLLTGLFIGITIIIPGIPISSFTMSLNKYDYLTNMTSSLSLTNIISISLFSIGIIIGIILISKIIYILLKKYKKVISILVLSFLLASIIILILDLNRIILSFNHIFTCLLSFLWGYLLAINLEKENDR